MAPLRFQDGGAVSFDTILFRIYFPLSSRSKNVSRGELVTFLSHFIFLNLVLKMKERTKEDLYIHGCHFKVSKNSHFFLFPALSPTDWCSGR